MDLEGAAVLSVCARCEKQRLEGQHERIWLVASGRWCLAIGGAVSRSASGSKRVQGRSASESGHAVSTLDRRARVEHHSASRGGIACHAGRGEGTASGGSFLCVSCAAAAASAVVGKTDCPLRDAERTRKWTATRCVHFVHGLSLICSPRSCS